jgi:hypothetical protein
MTSGLSSFHHLRAGKMTRVSSQCMDSSVTRRTSPGDNGALKRPISPSHLYQPRSSPSTRCTGNRRSGRHFARVPADSWLGCFASDDTIHAGELIAPNAQTWSPWSDRLPLPAIRPAPRTERRGFSSGAAPSIGRRSGGRDGARSYRPAPAALTCRSPCSCGTPRQTSAGPRPTRQPHRTIPELKAKTLAP